MLRRLSEPSAGLAQLIEDRERERLCVQAGLDAGKHALERNRMGQFATPTSLARDMLGYGQTLLGAHTPIRFLDPALGTGAFYSALLATVPPARVDRCLGFEIDDHYARPARALWHDSPLELRVEDFTAAAPPARDADRANLLICNPPYVRHHHMGAEQKRRLQALVMDRLGVRPSGLAGLYCHFLWLADAWLASGGVAGWLVPGEWMDVNYGELVKEYLLSRVKLIRIHYFAAHDVQFTDALVSSTILWFEKQAPDSHDDIELSGGGSLIAPERVYHVSNQQLRATRKWSQLVMGRAAHRQPCSQPARISASQPGSRPASQDLGLAMLDDQGASLAMLDDQGASLATLADLFAIKRGIATGANRFFVLSPEQIEEYDIPRRFLRPILPSPRYLDVDDGIIRARDDGSPDIAKRLYLLSADLPEQTIQSQHPRLWQYLQHGIDQGVSRRYLCRHRSPWYAQEARPPAPLLCTYMGRPNGSRGPFRFILNRSQAVAANVYLLLYPHPPLARAMAGDDALLARIWSALARLPDDVLVREGRVYGGGLYKLEPAELAHVPLAALDLDVAAFTRSLRNTV